MTTAIDATEGVQEQFLRQLHERADMTDELRIGAELKFPIVKPDGSVATRKSVDALWRYLADRDWQPVREKPAKRIVGARRPGEQNDTVATCETGYCKAEFALAHVGDLHELQAAVNDLQQLLEPFCKQQQVHFLG